MDPDTVIQQIEDVEIQGATNIAIAGVELVQYLDEQDTTTEEIDIVVDRLLAARPTEPMLRNAVQLARFSSDYEQVLRTIRDGKEQIARQWNNILDDGMTVYTHCHSSTVTHLLEAAAEQIDIGACVTETRPLYQGRETAQELADIGIPTTMYVDSGGRIALEEADIMLIGADAIAADGTVTNKIGSHLLAATAEQIGVPVHICSHSWKYDPQTRTGNTVSREERDPDEVWADAPEEVTINNYAFEHIPSRLITGIVSELGQIHPNEFAEAVTSEYDL